MQVQDQLNVFFFKIPINLEIITCIMTYDYACTVDYGPCIHDVR